MSTRALLGVVLAAASLSFATVPALGAGSIDPPAAAKPRNPDFDAGKASVERRDWRAAIASLQAATAREPSNVEAHNLLGYATRMSGDPRGSLVHYQKALSLDPKHLGAHEYVGEAYLMLDDLAQAEQHLAQLDKLCVFGCKEFRMLRDAVANYKKGVKPKTA
jgi:Flp pilus assembly protein TadD